MHSCCISKNPGWSTVPSVAHGIVCFPPLQPHCLVLMYPRAVIEAKVEGIVSCNEGKQGVDNSFYRITVAEVHLC